MSCVVPLPNIEHNLTVCPQGYEKEKQQWRDEIKAIKRAIAKFLRKE
tara:strand:- start:86 stop:226 length:141 start_codon:yes stop_codon:yes gene_type:complete